MRRLISIPLLYLAILHTLLTALSSFKLNIWPIPNGIGKSAIKKRLFMSMNVHPHEILVESDSTHAPYRLDSYLTKTFPRLSRSFLAGICQSGGVSVNNVPRNKSFKIHAGDYIRIENISTFTDSSTKDDLLPEYIPLKILYEDRDIILINKVAGMVVYPSPGTPAGTFANALRYHMLRSELSSVSGNNEDCESKATFNNNSTNISIKNLSPHIPNVLASVGEVECDTSQNHRMEKNSYSLLSCRRFGIVHRLDKGTTGVLLAAKSSPTVYALSKQFADRSVCKTYMCICAGNPCSTTIANFVARDEIVRTKMVVISRKKTNNKLNFLEKTDKRSTSGKLAISHIKTLASNNKFSICAVRIETGRTHQIRLHMSHINCPILGDSVYGRKEWNNFVQKRCGVERPMLHAYELSFNHPSSGEKMQIIAPLADDLRLVWRELVLDHISMDSSKTSELKSGLYFDPYIDDGGYLTDHARNILHWEEPWKNLIQK